MSAIHPKPESRLPLFLSLLSAACNPIIGVGGPVSSDPSSGGSALLCAPNEPAGGEPEVTDVYPDGQLCVVTYCDELDPDQQGKDGGDGPGVLSLPPDTRMSTSFTGGCEPDDGTCMPHQHLVGGNLAHRGRNPRHDRCANVNGPHPNDYYSGPIDKDVEATGADAVLQRRRCSNTSTGRRPTS